MTHREFLVPTDAEILDATGVSPESVGDEPTTRRFTLQSETGDEVVCSYDIPGRSFQVRAVLGRAGRIELVREFATRLEVDFRETSFRVRVEFESEELASTLNVVVGSTITIYDELLRV